MHHQALLCHSRHLRRQIQARRLVLAAAVTSRYRRRDMRHVVLRPNQLSLRRRRGHVRALDRQRGDEARRGQ